MKQAILERYGKPEDGVRCADAPDVGRARRPARSSSTCCAFPINPADISMCRGSYRLRPTLPATPGAECLGRVTAVGAGVTHVRVGDLVINLQRENWAQRRRVKGDDVIPVPATIDVLQGAMLRINPPTALLLLTDIVPLKPGDWVIQNVANSAVGRLVIRLAQARGIKTMNVVRRESLFAELKPLGADACVVDGPDLAERVKTLTGGASIRLGLDAVSGQATARLSACVGEGGVVCNYGSMSGEDPVMSARRAGRQRPDAGRLHPRPRLSPPARWRRSARSTPISASRCARASSRPRRAGLPDRGDRDGPGPRAARRAHAARSWSPRTGSPERSCALFLFVGTRVDVYNCRTASVRSGDERG